MPVREVSAEYLAAKAIERAGYTHIRIYRRYPAVGGEVEILFRASLRRGLSAVGPQLPYTAYLREEPGAEPLIADGW